jgi:hypothetical protein
MPQRLIADDIAAGRIMQTHVDTLCPENATRPMKAIVLN